MPGALPGFRDFYPTELAERAYIMRTWRAVARRYHFVEYDGPPLEPLDLYTRKSGEEIVGQLFNFVDKGGRDVSLRPEMTPTLARMVGARANALRKPVRWFSMPQLFRYEKAQRGRLREHFQLNVDIIGEPSVTADAELVACAIDIMRAFGLTSEDVRVRVSDRRILHGYLARLGVPEDAFGPVLGVIDKLERTPAAVSEEKLAGYGLDAAARRAVLELPQATLDSIGAALAGTEASALVEDFRRYLDYVAALTGDGAAWMRFDPAIVRGLAYYTGIVFELFDNKGQFRAIAGGGRYDNLLAALGGADLPALGFGMGDVVLGELLRDRGLMPAVAPQADFWVAGATPALLTDVMRVAAALRGRGYAVEYALREQSQDKQRKAAHAAGARQLVVLGTDFDTTRQVTIRTLADAKSGAAAEHTVALDAWLATLGEPAAAR